MRSAARGGLAASRPWLAEALAALGGLVYLLQALIYAHTQLSILDEGAYLYKGYLFATGRFRPFQEFGPWSNHMPLSFLIPGYVQAWFGPGLRTGRYFAVLLGLLFLLGLWLVVRRLGGRWWAAGAIWTFSLDPFLIKSYSVAVSQGMVAAMLIWILVLVLGEGRPAWQVVLGGALAGTLAVTRINLSPALPFVLLYILWQHGWRVGLLAAVAGIGVFLLVHALYWPNIYRLWNAHNPFDFLKPMFSSIRRGSYGADAWNPRVSPRTRVLSLTEGLRYNFVPLLGALSAWLFWPRREHWKKTSDLRLAATLSALFVVLAGFHAWSSLARDFCVFCFSGYLTFFSGLGIVLLVVTLPSWRRELPGWYQTVVSVLFLILAVGAGYGASNTPSFRRWAQVLIATEVPRVRASQVLPGSVPLWGLVENSLGLEYGAILLAAQTALATLAGGLLGALALVVAYRGQAFFERHGLRAANNFAARAAVGLMAAGLILSPTPLLAGGYQETDCRGDVIASYERVGAALAEIIPPGSRVYWQGGRSPAPLLYLPGVSTYPPQLNGVYSFRQGGDTQFLLWIGLWNQELAQRWVQEADFVLIEENLYSDWLKEVIKSGPYEEAAITPPTAECRPDSQIVVYRVLR